MNIIYLENFLILSNHLNYHKAAEEIFISTPALHKQIMLLEKKVGFKLFEKNGNKIFLTSSGENFKNITRNFLNEFYEYKTSLDNIANERKKLTIQTSSYISKYILTNFIKFFPKYTDISLIINNSNDTIYSQLINNKCDITISRLEPVHDKIKYITVCEGIFSLVVSKKSNFNTEAECFENYSVLNSPFKAISKDFKNTLLGHYPNVQINKIDDLTIAEFLLSENKGIAYLPNYAINNNDNLNIKTVQSDKILIPATKTYISWINQTKDVDNFLSDCQLFLNHS